MNSRSNGLGLAGVAALLVGCSSTPPPDAELSAAEVAVGEAAEADAAVHAPVMFQQAQEKLTQAKQAVSDERNTEARRFAEQAAIDAQVAEAQARAETATAHLRELQEGIDDLEEAPVEPIVLPQGG